MAWADRTKAVPNSFTGRPSPTNKEAAYQVRAAPVNQNFQAGQLAVAICQALGTEVADNSSTAILCKLTLLAGRFTPGDRLTIIEDRPTARVWCAVVTGTANVPLVEFGDAALHDSAKAGTADYDAIQNDLILLQIAPDDNAIWPKQSILTGGAHGLTGTDLPWKLGETDTIADKLGAAAGPAGNDKSVQFNDSGDFGGNDNFVWRDTDGTLIAGQSLAGGVANVTSSAVFGFDHDVATGADEVLVAGDSNEATLDGSRSTVLGHNSRANREAQVVNASGRFVANGDVQHTLSLIRKVATTDATPTLVASEPVESGKVYAVRGEILGCKDDGTSSHWFFRATIKNVGGTTILVAGGASVIPTLVLQDGGAAAWATLVSPNDGTDTLDVQVTGAAATNIRWAVALEMVEIAY